MTHSEGSTAQYVGVGRGNFPTTRLYACAPEHSRPTAPCEEHCSRALASQSFWNQYMRAKDMGNLDLFRAAGNPMFNDNKLKLGIFGSNCSNACAMTLATTSFEPTFEKNVEIARLLEAAAFECMVPIARWRGFGGPSNFNGDNMETYTWAAA